MFAAFAPALWGIGGAFIYAGPRWALALVGADGARPHPIIASLDLLICLACGAVAAGAFGSTVAEMALTMAHVKDHNAICAVIGLFVNPFAPRLVSLGVGSLDNGSSVFVRVLQAFRGTSEK